MVLIMELAPWRAGGILIGGSIGGLIAVWTSGRFRTSSRD